MKCFLLFVPLFSVLPMLPLVEEKGVALPEQVAFADAKIPKGVECKTINGQQVCTVTTVRPIATRAADCRCADCKCAAVAGVALDRECEPRFSGPVASTARASVRATGTVVRAVAYRTTHPFRGRFRR